jgi:predicted aminopeptidase
MRLREQVFARSREEWQRRIADHPNQSFRGFGQRPLNNAVLMHYMVYLKDLDLFESLYDACGQDLGRTIETLRKAVDKGGEPFEAVRTWLDKNRQQTAAIGD